MERTLTLTSDPPGALVYLNGQEIGRTPLVRDFTFYGNYDVQLRKEGYETVKTSANVIAPVHGWVPFDLLAELAPWRIRDNHDFNFTLIPASVQPAEPEDLMARGEEMRGQLQQDAARPTTGPAQ